MNTKEKYTLARWAVEEALKQGAGAVKVTISHSQSSSVTVREEKIDLLEQANRNNLSISLYVDHKYSNHSTNRLNNKKELSAFIKEAINGTKFLSEDPFRELPEPSLYFKGESPDLKIYDAGFEEVDPQQKINDAFDIEKEVLGTDDRIISVSGSYSDNLSETVMVTSNGFEGDRRNTYFGLSGSVSVKSGDSRPRSYWSESSLFHNTLTKQDIGRNALKRALEKIGQEKIGSARMPMIVENRVMAYSGAPLLSPLINAIYARSIQQKNSFLIDKIGEQIGSSSLCISEDPFIPSGRGSRLFDSEGLATKKRDLISDGILKTYLIDTYYGKKLGMDPNSGDITNLEIKPGDKTFDQLISTIDRGIYVTDFNGGNSNGVTGDFSYGIEGFLIEMGKPVKAISEMNITGNILRLWKNFVEGSSDVYENSSWRIPSLLFNEVDFSGV